VRHCQLRYDKRASQIDTDSIVPFLDVYLEDIAHTLAVARIHDEDVGMLTMLLFDFIEESLQVTFFANIALVG
jgi:hypothetical protein